MNARRLSLGLVAALFALGVAWLQGVSAQQAQVTICHVPPGNPDNPQTITIGAPAAEAHLRNHDGDHLGPCTAADTAAATDAALVDGLDTGDVGARRVDAEGGDAGSARGGDGGRGGSGLIPVCNQNTTGAELVDWYDEDGNYLRTTGEPEVACGAGGRGGEAGDGGRSTAGDGGVAFDIDFM